MTENTLLIESQAPLRGKIRGRSRGVRVKTGTDANWTRLTAALIESRAGWRRILQFPHMNVHALKELATAESARCTRALKHPAERTER